MGEISVENTGKGSRLETSDVVVSGGLGIEMAAVDTGSIVSGLIEVRVPNWEEE